MASLMESLASLSKLKLPGPQLTSLVEVLWKAYPNGDDIASQIQSEVSSLLHATSSGIAPKSTTTGTIALDTIPYWIMVSGIAARASEALRQSFLNEFTLPILAQPLHTSKTLSINHLEVIYRAFIQQAVSLATESDKSVWSALFVNILDDGSGDHSTDRKGSKSPRLVDITRWTVEALENQGKDVRALVDASLLGSYINMCLEYSKKSKEVAVYRTTIILSILPRILPKTFGPQIWQLFLILLNVKEGFSPATVDHASFRLQESDENTRLALETVVRFYEWLFTADAAPTSETSSQATLTEESFDLRQDGIFFEHCLFPALSSPDSVVRKRAIYLLKRMATSNVTIQSKWWSSEALKSKDGPSAMDRFLLLFDALDDHDFNILLSMWPLFDPLAALSSPNLLSSPDALLNDGLMKLFFRRCLWSESKLLQKWFVWFVFRHYHIPLIARFAADLTFCIDLLRETIQVFGWPESNLSSRDVSFIKVAKPEKHAERDSITHTSFHPFLASTIFSCANNPQNLSEEEYAVSYSRALIKTVLSTASLPASSVVTVLSFFASKSSVEGHKWPLPIFDSDTTIRLLNCLQSTFMGYTNEFAYLCMQSGLGALALHVDRSEVAVCPLLLQVIFSVNSYFKAKPAIRASLSSMVEYLASSQTDHTDADSIQSSSWLLSHLHSEVSSVFDISTHYAAVARSTNSIRSFDHAQEVLEKTVTLLSLLSPSNAVSFLKHICGLVLSHIRDQPTTALSSLAILANFAQTQDLVWSEFLNACAPLLKSNIDEISKSLATLNYDAEEPVDSLNKSVDHFGGVYATSSLLALLKATGIDCQSLESSLSTIRLVWKETAQGPYDAFSSLAAFTRLSDTSHSLPIGTVTQLIRAIFNYNVPHRTPSGIDGPTWKHFSALFETARWTALDAICSVTDVALLAQEQSQQLRELIESCLERSENAHKRDMPLSTNVLKWLLKALPSADTDVTCDDLNAWMDRLEMAGRQEKTFSSKVVFFVMGAALQPALLVSRRYAPSTLNFIDKVFLWSETGVGPANWLVRLIEYAIFYIPKDLVSGGDMMTVEEFAISMAPTFKRLLSFGPERSSNVQTPANVDMQLAGLDLPPVSPILRTLGKKDVTHAEEHAIQADYLRDSQVRFATASLITMVLKDFKKFNTELLRCLYEVEQGAESSSMLAAVPANSKLMCERKGSLGHMRLYHLLQLTPFLAANAEPQFFVENLWPILSVDNLSSVRELVTLTASVFIWRIVYQGEGQEATMMDKIAEMMRVLLDEAPKSSNEDSLFAWISLAGYTLKQVDLKKRPDLKEPWRKILLSVLPFLSFNTLYIRGTAQDVVTGLLDLKEGDIRDVLAPEFVDWLVETRTFLRTLYEMRPLNRINRREAFAGDFLQYFKEGGQGYDDDPRGRILKTLKLIYAVHPVQHELPPTDHFDPLLIYYEFGRLFGKIATKSEVGVDGVEQKSNASTAPSSAQDPSVSHPDAAGSESISENDAKSSVEGDATDSKSSSPLPPSTFQRKIVPWQGMDLGDAVSKRGKGDAGEASEGYKDASIGKATRQEIIVVATLLNKMPNLGGLTRTAEIFAASKLIIPSMAILQDKQFQEISVSADHWLPMEEVTDTQLTDYLLAQKRNGYTLVGLEQTSTSHAIQNYTFPDKTVLLLGNERRGIPVELLQLLDASVEIPQLGLIRSLNVHVSASICIWEYTKQHL